jgi:hypothetical protein
MPNTLDMFGQAGPASNDPSTLTNVFDFSTWQAPIDASSMYTAPEQLPLANTGYKPASAPVQGTCILAALRSI